MALEIRCCCCKRRLWDLNRPHARWLQPTFSEQQLLSRVVRYQCPIGWAHTRCADDADFWRLFMRRFLIS